MKAQKVYENIKFTKSKSPKETMGIGIHRVIKKNDIVPVRFLYPGTSKVPMGKWEARALADEGKDTDGNNLTQDGKRTFIGEVIGHEGSTWFVDHTSNGWIIE